MKTSARHKTDVQNTGWKKVRAARWPKLMFAHAKSACLHAQWLQPFFFGRRAVLLFQCRSWVSVWMNMFFNCLLIFCVTHTKKNGPRILISLCHLQGGSNLHTLFSLETSTQFKFGFGWFFFCHLVRRHKMPVEAEGKTHFEWSGPFNSGHWTADSLHQMNTFVEHKWWPQNLCAWNYQYIQFADKYMNCIVNEFNLHENNREKKIAAAKRTKTNSNTKNFFACGFDKSNESERKKWESIAMQWHSFRNVLKVHNEEPSVR